MANADGVSRRRVSATYRLQLREGVTFDRAAALVPYLAELGVSHLYVSPIFAAAEGSTHGYDVIDANAIEPALGGEPAFLRLSEALVAHGLGLIVDFVPNHMAASPQNPWWHDVLQWGALSAYANHFDIDWSAPRLLLPVLPQSYGETLSAGGLSVGVDFETGELRLDTGGFAVPLTPPSYVLVLNRTGNEVLVDIGRELESAEPEDTRALQSRLAAALTDPHARSALVAAGAAISSSEADLHALHEAQAWRLAHWRAARDSLTYRRFFEITDLVGVTVEREATFQDLHRTLLRLVAEGHIDGIRLDHVDGLADPKAYCLRLREALGRAPVAIYAEKILEPGEWLRDDWQIDGTTGYEFIAAIADALVEPARLDVLAGGYAEFVGRTQPIRDDVLAVKRQISAENLAAELDGLSRLACVVGAAEPSWRDVGADTLKRTIAGLAAAMPVYRTYVDGDGASPADRIVIEAAITAAARFRDLEYPDPLAFLKALVTRDPAVWHEPEAARAFVIRFQQMTGPAMAKAVEDTMFYRLNSLIALNEVGADPLAVPGGVDGFHAFMIERSAAARSGSLSATATHDTKRGEDARARLYLLSEVPDVWLAAVRRWSGMLAPVLDGSQSGVAPDRDLVWTFFQALLGAWPATLEVADRAGLDRLCARMEAYLLKAAREAKLITTWTAPDQAAEGALVRFVQRTLDPSASLEFLRDFRETTRPLMLAGAATSLSQLAIKMTAPGVPDIYQGCELWDLSLVDPDNRRPPPFDVLSAAVRADADDLDSLLRTWVDGRIKLHITSAALAVRQELPDVFAQGTYLPLRVTGEKASHVIAFARAHTSGAFLTVAPVRTAVAVAGNRELWIDPAYWGATTVELPVELASVEWSNAVTGKTIAAADRIPVAALLDVPVAMLRST